MPPGANTSGPRRELDEIRDEPNNNIVSTTVVQAANLLVGHAFGMTRLWSFLKGESHTSPPRPETSTPTVEPEPASSAKASPEGTVIVLEVAFGDDWPARGLAWQGLWTVVEWQDTDGTWHEVAGWQGGLDKVGGGLGRKAWWLEDGLLGRGPFRWVIYEHQGGAVMVTSDPFNLPDRVGETFAIKVLLSQ